MTGPAKLGVAAGALALLLALGSTAGAEDKTLFPEVFKGRPAAKAGRSAPRTPKFLSFGTGNRTPRIIDFSTTGSTVAPPPAAGPPAAAADTAPFVPTAPIDNAALYCQNITDLAAAARFARQADALAALEKALADRVAELEAKRADYEKWVSRREEFLNKAEDSVVAIYSQMRPDAAAPQFAVMDQEAAAAILAKLSPRIASAVLNEMDAATAAQLTNTMAGMAQPKKVAEKAP